MKRIVTIEKARIKLNWAELSGKYYTIWALIHFERSRKSKVTLFFFSSLYWMGPENRASGRTNVKIKQNKLNVEQDSDKTEMRGNKMKIHIEIDARIDIYSFCVVSRRFVGRCRPRRRRRSSHSHSCCVGLDGQQNS